MSMENDGVKLVCDVVKFIKSRGVLVNSDNPNISKDRINKTILAMSKGKVTNQQNLSETFSTGITLLQSRGMVTLQSNGDVLLSDSFFHEILL